MTWRLELVMLYKVINCMATHADGLTGTAGMGWLACLPPARVTHMEASVPKAPSWDLCLSRVTWAIQCCHCMSGLPGLAS